MDVTDAIRTTLRGVAAPPRLVVLEPGDVIGDVHVSVALEERIGEGGTAIVFGGHVMATGESVACKVLRPELVSNPAASEPFSRELAIALALSHPNVVRVSHVGLLGDGRPFMVSERLHGQTLEQRLEAGPMHLGDVCAVASDVVAGLEAVHRAGYVHGDIKPANVFLATAADGECVAKLLDFGVAASQPLPGTAPRTHRVVGTLPYMAPERRRGYVPTAQTDAYALGVTLYTMLVGRRPFEGHDNELRIDASMRLEELIAPTALVSAVPVALSAAVVQLLAADPAERPTLAEVRGILSQHRSSGLSLQWGAPPRAITETPRLARVLPENPDRHFSDTVIFAANSRRRWLPWAVAGAAVVAAIAAFVA